MNYKIITQCRICASTDLVPWLDLGSQPLANRLLFSPDEIVPSYPLKVVRCVKCDLSQLTAVVDPKEMFTDYPFRAGVSASWRNHCRDLVDSLPYDYSKKGLVIDIGSNDATLLDAFSTRGMKTLGVDPATIIPVLAGEIRQHNLINAYWSKKDAQYIVDDPYHGRAQIITATNVLAHVEDVHEFMEAVKIALADDGLFVVEAPTVYNLIEKCAFDTVYHEHLSYFTCTSLRKLFNMHGFVVIRYHVKNIHGGSHHFVLKKGAIKIDLSVRNELDYAGFQKKVMEIPKNLMRLLALELDWSGSREPILGYGASAKATVFLNALAIKKELIPFVVDDCEKKWQKYIPGIGSAIVSPNIGFDSFAPMAADLQAAKYLFILSWNVAEDIKRQAREAGFEGKFLYRKGTGFVVEM